MAKNMCIVAVGVHPGPFWKLTTAKVETIFCDRHMKMVVGEGMYRKNDFKELP